MMAIAFGVTSDFSCIWARLQSWR